MNFAPQINSLLTKIKEDLIQDHISKGQVASGQLQDGFRVESSATQGALYGVSYFKYLVTGRGPGKFPPVDKLREWVRVTGMATSAGISENSLAYLIGRKIANEGTDIFQGKRPGIDFDGIVDKNFEEFRERIAKLVVKEQGAKLKKAIES